MFRIELEPNWTACTLNIRFFCPRLSPYSLLPNFINIGHCLSLCRCLDQIGRIENGRNDCMFVLSMFWFFEKGRENEFNDESETSIFISQTTFNVQQREKQKYCTDFIDASYYRQLPFSFPFQSFFTFFSRFSVFSFVFILLRLLKDNNKECYDTFEMDINWPLQKRHMQQCTANFRDKRIDYGFTTHTLRSKKSLRVFVDFFFLVIRLVFVEITESCSSSNNFNIQVKLLEWFMKNGHYEWSRVETLSKGKKETKNKFIKFIQKKKKKKNFDSENKLHKIII